MDGGRVLFEPGGGVILREIAGVSVRDVLCSSSSASLWILSWAILKACQASWALREGLRTRSRSREEPDDRSRLRQWRWSENSSDENA